MTSSLVAYYFSLIVSWQDYPILVGEYNTWSDCASVREFLDRRGYETGDCSLLPLPQESIHLEVGYLPYENTR